MSGRSDRLYDFDRHDSEPSRELQAVTHRQAPIYLPSFSIPSICYSLAFYLSLVRYLGRKLGLGGDSGLQTWKPSPNGVIAGAKLVQGSELFCAQDVIGLGKAGRKHAVEDHYHWRRRIGCCSYDVTTMYGLASILEKANIVAGG